MTSMIANAHRLSHTRWFGHTTRAIVLGALVVAGCGSSTGATSADASPRTDLSITDVQATDVNPAVAVCSPPSDGRFCMCNFGLLYVARCVDTGSYRICDCNFNCTYPDGGYGPVGCPGGVEGPCACPVDGGMDDATTGM